MQSNEALVPALAAASAARVAIFAFRIPGDMVSALPVTPYVLGTRIVITSTLAYAKKAEYVRSDPRVALLAQGVHMIGDADVRADSSGKFFVENLLDQELAKYPPARALLKVPFHRRVFAWFFGRAVVFVEARAVEARPGEDRATLITLDEDGYPSIRPLPRASPDMEDIALDGFRPQHEQPAQVLFHRESEDMSELRHMTLHGFVRESVFHTQRRAGSLDADRPDSELARRLRARRARAVMKEWPGP